VWELICFVAWLMTGPTAAAAFRKKPEYLAASPFARGVMLTPVLIISLLLGAFLSGWATIGLFLLLISYAIWGERLRADAGARRAKDSVK
jgi:hypothetical protein